MFQKIKKIFVQEFFKNTIIQWLMIAVIFSNLANWAALAFFIRKVDFPIILHYNIYFGVDIIGNWWEAYFLPASGTAILLIDALMAYFFFRKKERIAAYMLFLAAFFVQAGIAIAIASIVMINY